jgi:2-beta-glucuronyltransferase
MIDDYPRNSNILHIPHGLEKGLFDIENRNPYKTKKNAICVGDMLFDEGTVVALARAFPDWHFYLFGKNARVPSTLPNVVCHGETPFSEIIPYLQHADIGLAPYRPAVNADYLSQSSMKMIQYTYCKLPIVAPHFAATGRQHVFGYDPNDTDSIKRAMSAATICDRSKIDTTGVMDWGQTVDAFLSGINRESIIPGNDDVPTSRFGYRESALAQSVRAS